MADQSITMNNQAVPTGSQAPAMAPMVAKPAESDLLKNIVSAETAGTPESILGEAPELDRSLLQEVAPQKSILLVFLKILFGVLVIAGLGSLLFFSSQLTPKLDFITTKFNLPNVSNDLASSNTEIIGLQTDLNLSRFQEIKMALDKFSYDGDQYLLRYETMNSNNSSSQEKQMAKNELAKTRANLKISFLAARDKFVKSLTAPLIDENFGSDKEAELMSLYEDRLRMAISDKMKELANAKEESTKMNYRNYQQTLKLIGNNELKNTLIKADFDALSDKDLNELIKKVNSLTVNDMSVVQNIKTKRIKWSDVIKEINDRTRNVDKSFDDKNFNEVFYKAAGGIRYNSYDFDSSTGKVSISGETKRTDTTNFTTIADLIDELNKSMIFSDASMRSFSKSGSIEQGYLATLKLDLNLKDNPNVIKTK
ncbi:hypothetical protein HZA40_03070 [Candidatus Peregrinibacteria bacterium]|nr:hypothetical protein [Candidatus Peregrinibacteria bacterium]